jgi:hypothetical protein
MNEEKLLRDELIFHLTVGHAHMSFEDAVADFPLDKVNALFPNGDYTFWHLLEHIRRTQNDILDFMVHSNYKDKKWPEAYWPGKNEKATKKEWDTTIKSFLKDREQLEKLVADPKTDLYKKLPHGTGQTVMREIIVVTDHNAYHLGEFAIMRQVLNAWGEKHT